MSTALTHGIRVTVKSAYRPDRSVPAQGRYLFTYTVNIANQGARPAKLVARHWIITDASGEKEEVAGQGVVGHQPHLAPGESFEYTSQCVLKTPLGAMRGTYQMLRDDGSSFQAEIAPFSLAVPHALN
ncbi:MAG TPA: Co2+/Mg2+ efflux protein ApaG [Anaeromyxobacteraceae bacterium]|nr:Co2+/Mg2+ efflux protein ApaG [Anaeromyxobacteraceae bacterium]